MIYLLHSFTIYHEISFLQTKHYTNTYEEVCHKNASSSNHRFYDNQNATMRCKISIMHERLPQELGQPGS